MTTQHLIICQFLLPETETSALNSDNVFSSKVFILLHSNTDLWYDTHLQTINLP